MSIKTIVTALTLVMLPGLGLAQDCRNGRQQDQQAMTCIPGTQWDAEAGACLPVASS